MVCNKCNDKGRIGVMVWSGAFMFRPCDCETAKENERKVLEKYANYRQELLESLNNLKS